MDLFECIHTRRSVRNYSNKKIEFDKITLILEAATKAPTSGNLQDYRFIIVNDKEKIRALADHCNEQHWIATAPTLIIVCADTERTETYYGLRGQRLYAVQNAAAAAQNILLAAHALGIGACWIGAFNEEYISDEFNLPGKVRPQAIITLGYQEGELDPKTENDLDAMIFFNSYGSKVENMNLLMREYSKEIDKALARGDKKINQNIKTFKGKIKTLFSKTKEKFESNNKK
ncbi:nitroreductase family protein [Candidatus Woesearchaeota archaeon]|jgi:nitroreductase|nr:nitroreductase family protein [Candidatus Woesearchaeota archaeon]